METANKEITTSASAASTSGVATRGAYAETACEYCGKRYRYDRRILCERAIRYRCRSCGGVNALVRKTTVSKPEAGIEPNAAPATRSAVEGNNPGSLSPVSVFGEARASFSESWRQLAGILLIFLGHLQLYRLFIVAGERFDGATGDISAAQATASFLLFILLFVSACWTHGAVFQWLADKRICVLEAYRRAWRKLAGWIGLLCMFFFIVLGGFVLMGIPAVVFSVIFSFSFFVFAEKDATVTDSLLESLDRVSGRATAAGVCLWTVWLPSMLAVVLLGWWAAIFAMPFVALYMHVVYGRLGGGDCGSRRGDHADRRPEPWQCVAVLGFASFAIFINQFDIDPVDRILKSLAIGM